jgi:hypothetical protein
MQGSAMKTQRTFQQPGDYAGRGVYEPRDRRGLKRDLGDAIGRTVDLDFAGVAASDERYAGQNLYQERGAGRILHGSWIPEEDVRFSSEPIDGVQSGTPLDPPRDLRSSRRQSSPNGPPSPQSSRSGWLKGIVVAGQAMARILGLSSTSFRKRRIE